MGCIRRSDLACEEAWAAVVGAIIGVGGTTATGLLEATREAATAGDWSVLAWAAGAALVGGGFAVGAVYWPNRAARQNHGVVPQQQGYGTV